RRGGHRPQRPRHRLSERVQRIDNKRRGSVMKLRWVMQAAVLACSSAAAWATAAPSDEARARVEQAASRIAAELAQVCPVADPGDQVAFDACRGALFRGSQFKRSLQDF